MTQAPPNRFNLPYSLWVYYPAALFGSGLDQKIEHAMGQSCLGSGCDNALRDMDFTFESQDGAHTALLAVEEIMPPGSKVQLVQGTTDIIAMGDLHHASAAVRAMRQAGDLQAITPTQSGPVRRKGL